MKVLIVDDEENTLNSRATRHTKPPTEWRPSAFAATTITTSF